MLHLIKTIINKAYIIFLMCFTVWYGFFLYPIIWGHSGDHDVEVGVEVSADASADDPVDLQKMVEVSEGLPVLNTLNRICG